MTLSLPLTPTRWGIWGSDWPSERMRPVADGDGWKFDFPVHSGSAGRTVNYIYTHHPTDLTKFASLDMAFEITGSAPVFMPTDGGTARATLFFQRAGDDGTLADASFRWWSRLEFVNLAVGKFTMSALLTDPNQWSNVNGTTATNRPLAFNTAKLQCANIGFTLGGTFLGHGVYLKSGSASFHLKSYVLGGP